MYGPFSRHHLHQACRRHQQDGTNPPSVTVIKIDDNAEVSTLQIESSSLIMSESPSKQQQIAKRWERQ